MATELVSLKLLVRQQERLITDVAGLRDDLSVLTAIVLCKKMLNQLSQWSLRRLRKQEKQVDGI
jgi:hypothetical protein